MPAMDAPFVGRRATNSCSNGTLDAPTSAISTISAGVTISGPLVVSRMTSTIDVQMGEKVLEIGTGSGNQSAYLSNLTDKVWTIEIIKPLAERTRGIYDDLIGRG